MKAFFISLSLLFCATWSFGQVVVSGEITSNTTWTSDKTYLLSGFVYVKNGATLTIQPGTTIKGDKATKGTLIVTRGAKINANGNPSQPIVFTSNSTTPDYGDWGGIIILGKAGTNQTFNATAGVGEVEGGVNNAAGDGLYGGGDLAGGAVENDNSGILRYVRIEYPGIAFAPNNEINGLTMAGVGSGTVIEYIQVSYANDDAFEWFGGTVNCKYLIAYKALDDDFDADFGFRGSVQFGFSLRDPNIADVSGSNGFEVDNDATSSDNTPKTAPTFSNMTIVGPTGTVNANYRRAAHLRRNNEIKLFNSVFVGTYPVGLLVDGAKTIANAQSGKMRVKNCYFYGQTKQLDTLNAAGASFDIATWFASGANQRGANAADLKLANPFDQGLPNAIPAAGSPLLGGAAFADSAITSQLFIKVPYAGAFGPTGNWTCGWSKFANGDCPASPEVIVSGVIGTNTTWTADKTYILSGFVYVKNGASLTIQPGTTIKGDKATKGALIVTAGSKIIADATETQPIVFTSAQASPEYGDWGGLIILGKASTNQTFGGQAGRGEVEGGVNNAAGDGLYGGTDDNDNSGVLRYVRIEYPGIAFQPNNEINGLTLAGVGRGTVIDHVQVSYSGDDSFEWFGGTVNAKHLIAYRGVDDDFDCDFGFRGSVQFALSIRDANVADASASNGFEIDNDAAGSTTTPKTAPTFSNVTILGPAAGTVAADYKRAAHIRRNSEPAIFNSLFMGSYPVGILVDGVTTGQNALDNKLEVKNCIVAGPTTPLSVAGTNNPLTIATWFGTSGWGNSTLATAADVKLQDAYNLNDPNAQPTGTSPARTGASFAAARLAGTFFTPTSYIGAFGGSADWTCQWTRFAGGVNTSCNVNTQDFAEVVPSLQLMPTVTATTSQLALELADQTDLDIRVYTMDGRLVQVVAQDKLSSGSYMFNIDANQLQAGLYFVQVSANSAVKTEKLIVIK
jgi:hypothetical protein